MLDHDPQAAGASAFPAVGITRGKKLVVLIGQKKAPGIAVRNDRPQRRYSGLLASLKGKKGTEGSTVESKTASQSRVVS